MTNDIKSSQMTNDETTIRQLLHRFMDGETTVEEEALIGKWFREHPKASPDLEAYRQMFAWFDAGMPEQPPQSLWSTASIASMLSTVSTPSITSTPSTASTPSTPSIASIRSIRSIQSIVSIPSMRRPLLFAASIAAAAVLTATIFFLRRPAPTQPHRPQITAIADSVVKPEAQHQEATKPSPSPDTMEPQRNTEAAKKADRRSYYRHQFSPAPPKPLVALTDSMVEEGERLVETELARMEAEQQEAYRQFDLSAAATDSIFTAILQEGESEVY